MAPRKSASRKPDDSAKLLKDLLIVQLGLAGVTQNNIRAIVSADSHYVNKIVRMLPKQPRKSSAAS
jgi:hypothetical protein